MGKDNIRVFADTLKQIGKTYGADKSEVRCYTKYHSADYSDDHTPITMVHGGTVSTGYANVADDMRVAILNFANATVPGGCVMGGSNAQEENICRCTNLYPLLAADECEEGYYKPNGIANLCTQAGVYTDSIIYARDVIVFKDDVTYDNIEPKVLDVITCPAPSARLADLEAVVIYANRIKEIVISAIDNDVDCIVLGAWGCGAFGQNPELIAKAFAIVLNWYGGYFEKIIFAIRATPFASDDFYTIFEQVFLEDYVGGVQYEE